MDLLATVKPILPDNSVKPEGAVTMDPEELGKHMGRMEACIELRHMIDSGLITTLGGVIDHLKRTVSHHDEILRQELGSAAPRTITRYDFEAAGSSADADGIVANLLSWLRRLSVPNKVVLNLVPNSDGSDPSTVATSVLVESSGTSLPAWTARRCPHKDAGVAAEIPHPSSPEELALGVLELIRRPSGGHIHVMRLEPDFLVLCIVGLIKTQGRTEMTVQATKQSIAILGL